MSIFDKIKHAYRVTHSIVREASKKKLRSPYWDEVREEFLKTNSSCVACGSTKRLQVHHIKPFRSYPELELTESNLITLCMDEKDCHLSLGHGGNFKCWNPNVIEDASTVRQDQTKRSAIEKFAKQNRKK